MKTLIYTLFSIALFLSHITFGQEQNNSPKTISNNIIVRMQKGEDPAIIKRLSPANYELTVDKVLSRHSDIWLLKFNDENTNISEVIDNVLKIDAVLFAQPNREVELRATPNDPDFGSQWQHDNIDSELAWDITTGGSTANGHDIVVALIESADLINHPDLQDNHWKNTDEIPNNGIDDDGNGYVDDYNGWNVGNNNDNIGAGSHGTSCAGMIGAKGDNGTGVAGINWDVKIMNVAGYANPSITEASVIASYDYALNARLLWNQTNGDSGAFVVATSSSWGMDGADPNDYPIWCSFYDDLGAAGILNAGATTNQNQDVDTFGDVPTGCASDYMIGVTATDQSDIIDFAGYGEQTINVAAPGSGIYTTAPNGGYTQTSGTSFACPLTAGMIGLLYSIPCNNLEALALNNPQYAADLVREALYDGVDQSQHLIQRTISGGRINAKNSIDLLMTEVCSDCPAPFNIITSMTGDYEASTIFDAEDEADSYIVSIQVAGSNNWTDFTITDTTFTFTGLNSCTAYEYHVSSVCDGEVSSPSAIVSFQTTGCGNCIELNYCETTAENPEVDLMVNSPASIEGSYNFIASTNFGGSVDNGYDYGELILVDDGTANPNEGCNALINGNEVDGNIAVVYRGSCNFTVKAMNAQNAGASAIIVINNVNDPIIDMGGTDNNVTIPAVMISQSDGATLVNAIENNESPSAILGQQNEWIASFEINGNTIASGDDNGYRFNDNSIDLIAGDNYPFILTPGFDGQDLEEYTRIWLDLNQDGTFDNSELVYDQTAPSFGQLSDAFTVPASATLGSTRMRVQMAYQGFDNSTLPNVCGDFTSGEVEDFCVHITSGISCNMTVNSTVTLPQCNELQNGEIALTVTDGNPAFSYQWNNGETTPNISNLGANNYSVIITDDNGCDTTVNFTLEYLSALSLEETITSPSCPDAEDGSINVEASGGSNFTYDWLNGPSSSTWSGVDAGNYQVTATDELGCQITESFLVSNPNVPAPIVSFTTNHNYLVVDFNNYSQNANAYEWDFDDGNNSTDFEPTHTYINDGVYDVCLTAFGDCDTVVECKSITVERDHTGLNDEAINLGVNVYPNPASSFISIEKEIDQISSAVIYAANGKVVNEVNLSSVKTQVSIQDWPSGVYYIHFMNNKEEFLLTKRLSIIH